MNDITRLCLSTMSNPTVNPLATAAASKTLISREEYNKIKLKSYVLEEDEEMLYEFLTKYVSDVEGILTDLSKYKEDTPVQRGLKAKKEMAQLLSNKLRKEPKLLEKRAVKAAATPATTTETKSE